MELKILDGAWSKCKCRNIQQPVVQRFFCITLVCSIKMFLFCRETFSSPDNHAVATKLVENSLVLLPNSTAAMLKGWQK